VSYQQEGLFVHRRILEIYPMSVQTFVAACWELYMAQEPRGQSTLSFAVRPFLARMGKTYGHESLRELEGVLYDLYRIMRVGYQRQYVDGVDTIIIWLTPEIIKRVQAAQTEMEATDSVKLFQVG